MIRQPTVLVEQIVPICICAVPLPERWPQYQPIGGYICARCKRWKSA
jgi:hypothetical protein